MFQILIQEIKFSQTLIGIIHERQNFTLVYFYEKIWIFLSRFQILIFKDANNMIRGHKVQSEKH